MKLKGEKVLALVGFVISLVVALILTKIFLENPYIHDYILCRSDTGHFLEKMMNKIFFPLGAICLMFSVFMIMNISLLNIVILYIKKRRNIRINKIL